MNDTIITLEEGWSDIMTNAIQPLQDMLDSGMRADGKKLNNKHYAHAYSRCYSMCTQPSPYNWSEALYQRHGECISTYLRERVLPVLITKAQAVNAYSGDAAALTSGSASSGFTLGSGSEQSLLKEFSTRWDYHKIMNKWMKNFFRYLNRYQVQYHNVLPLESSGLMIYRQVVYDDARIKSKVVGAILALIDQERNGGEAAEAEVVRACVQVFISMGETLSFGNKLGATGTTSTPAAANNTAAPPAARRTTSTTGTTTTSATTTSTGTSSASEDAPLYMAIFVSDLENALVNATRSYYSARARAWLDSNSTPEYMRIVENALTAEQNRCRSYLTAHTEQRFVDVITEECIAARVTAIVNKEDSGCAVLLVKDSVEDLARMYSLLSRVSTGLNPMCEVFKTHIISLGSDLIQRRGAKLETIPEKERERDVPGGAYDPQFMKDILALHAKYGAMVSTSFSGNGLFQRSLKDAFTDIVNRELTGSPVTFADVLATYTDRMLRSGSAEKLSDAEIENCLSQIVDIFGYITDKDIFAEIYRNQLAKRLLNQRSLSDDMEKLMISKLKLRCGAQFTTKMEGMLNDLATAVEHQAEFATTYKRVCASATTTTSTATSTATTRASAAAASTASKPSGSEVDDFATQLSPSQASLMSKCEFSVQVLTTGHWPTYRGLPDAVMPDVMGKMCDCFALFYAQRTTHRRLAWMHVLGNAAIRANFASLTSTSTSSASSSTGAASTTTAGANKVYELQTSTLQAAILLLFNNLPAGTTSLSTEYVLNALHFGDEITKRVLHSLSMTKIRVLKKSTPDNSIKLTDEFSVNEQFSNPLRKVRLPVLAIGEDGGAAGAAGGAGAAQKTIEEDRGFAIEAAAVRIMKSRKVLGHQQLVGEILQQLAFFQPNPKVIKRKLENLIEREFLERDPNQPNVYRYLA